MRIMIVDDNTEMRELIRNLLSDLAEEIYTYPDGASALADFDRHRPDWSVVDVRMPGMDGLTVTSWIKRRHPEAQVAVITQSNNAQMKAAALQSGATAFVPKENLSQLRSVIMCERRRLPVRDEGETHQATS